jgi:glycosyltransferase involved in cell wall biosynthesis
MVWLARGLAELGHRITLLALEGSRIPEATVVPVPARQLRSPEFDINAFLPPSLDILHAHAPLRVRPECPEVFTLHGNLRPDTTPPANTIFVSGDHAKRHGGTAFVYNGVDPSDFTFQSRKDDYDLFLGRLHRIKGYRWAIEGTKRAGRRLVIAGGWRPSLRRSLRFVGAVEGERKARLLAGAACLWMPALWDEPFGLTLVEAMVSGTPILGTRRGALPEVVSKEVGALGDTVDDLVRLRATMGQYDPDACRARAERWFSHVSMAQEYVRMYQHYLLAKTLPSGRLIT